MTELNYTGLKCPMPTTKLSQYLKKKLPKGTMLVVIADCDKFPNLIDDFCRRKKLSLISKITKESLTTCTIRV